MKNPHMLAKAKQLANRITLDCIHLGESVYVAGSRNRSYRECDKGYGPQCACDKPQKCGPMCADYSSKTERS